MSSEQNLHSEVTGKIIGCAIEVHKTLRKGFHEGIYKRALEIEMAGRGLSFNREHEMDVFYKGTRIGSRGVDFLVEGKVMVEVRVISQLEEFHVADAINYLEAFGLEVGMLLNFGKRSLQFKPVLKPNRPIKRSG